MAPSVKIKDGRRVAVEQCSAGRSWCDGYLLPTYDLIRVCWGQAVVTATLGRAGLETAGAGAGWEDIYIILECRSPPCGCLHCTAVHCTEGE